MCDLKTLHSRRAKDKDKKKEGKKKVPIPVPPPPASTFAIIRIQAVKTTIVDHILGLHMPLAQVWLGSVFSSASFIPQPSSFVVGK